MSIKSELLAALIKNDGNFISGEALSNKLFCSRNAVWKAVKSLRDSGFEIEATTNKGYRLISAPDTLSADTVESFLGHLEETLSITVLDTVSSTNDYAKELAAKGAKEGTIIIAQHQTGGKGRLGRSFYSPEKTGIYLSILLRPDIPLSECLLITSSAAVAVAEAIEAVSGKRALIKWVNDIFVDGKKVCGILTEASTDIEVGGLSYAVVGIGVNVTEPEGGFPNELKGIVTALFKSGEKAPRAQLAAEIIKRFFPLYRNVSGRAFLKEYTKRSLLLGKEVRVINGSIVTPAIALEIDRDCRLRVRFKDGDEKWLSSGEVSVKL